jgi:aspartyl-tRNA(Asn)/glutamyl-tRNA(Gln) amidotransferase subunit A
MGATDVLNMTISEAAAQLERRTLSPVELTDAMVHRIAAVDKALNAYITVCGEEARAVAQAAEKMIGAGYHLGPLHGIPVAIKDNIYTRGVRTTAGSKILADFVPAEDATVTTRLKRAGAVIIGKTNLHEFAWGGTTDNLHYGTCRNPWNL